MAALLKAPFPAHSRNVDMVFLGTRGLGGVGKMLLGSTTAYILDHAPSGCSLFVAKS